MASSSDAPVKCEVPFCGCQVSVLSDGSDNPPKRFLIQTAKARSRQQKHGAFFVGDLGRVVRQYREEWSVKLPNVRPFYAVKSNDDPVLLGVLARLGAGFDCGSKREIERVLAVIDPAEAMDRIIFTNPFKKPSHIRYAAETGIDLLTFDTEAELKKIKCYPKARAVMRIKPNNAGKVEEHVNLEQKFGVDTRHAGELLDAAARLGINVVGVSFHVGSRCFDPSAYSDTIRAAAELFDVAAEERFGFRFEVLDIGGGFYGDASPPVSFDEVAAVVRDAIDENFPRLGRPGSTTPVRVIAEPGEFFSMSAFTLAANVIALGRFGAREDESQRGAADRTTSGELACRGYVLSDGVFGSLAYTPAWLKLRPEPVFFAEDTARLSSATEECRSTLWGPTCTGRDCVVAECLLPKLELGDWVVFEDVGAYTMVTASEFNGVRKAKRLYVVEERYADELKLL